MAQHDMNVANGTGAAVRADLNNALSAIATNNSGSSDPSTTFASQYFANTSTGIMQLRNTSNNGFVNLFSLTGGPQFAVDGLINSQNIGMGANSVSGNVCFGAASMDSAITGGGNTGIGSLTLSALTSGTTLQELHVWQWDLFL